jgi:hypothetical protein
VRRLVFSRYDLQRAWARVAAFLAIRAPQPKSAPQRAEQLSSLFKAKERAGEAAPRAVEPPPIVGAPPAVTPTVKPPANGPASTSAPASASRPSSATSATPATSTSAALLARKKSRSGERDSSKS